jgi:hypothetical protein
MTKPIFYASEVAALIGAHRFKTREEALLRVFESIPACRVIVNRVKAETGARTEREIVRDAPASIRATIETAVTSAVSATTQAEVQKTIETFQHTTAETLLRDTIAGKYTDPDFKAAAKRVLAGATTIAAESTLLETTPTVTALTREIQKQRGTKLESVAEDAHHEKVTNRGDAVRYECDAYTIVGYIDGMANGKIVETKNRKRFWREPPSYDIIQLRCYMKMKGCVDGVLLECFPGYSPRETPVAWDGDVWASIDKGLAEVAEWIGAATPTEIEHVSRKALTKMD